MRPARSLSLLTALSLLSLAACSDLPELADEDLRLHASEVPDSENGALKLVHAGASLSDDFDAERARKMAQGEEPWDEAFVNDAVLQNAAALEGMDRALQAPAFVVPPEPVPRDGEPVASPVEQWARLPSLAALSVAQERRDGRPQGALEGALTIVLLGHRIETGSSQLLPTMLGLTFRRSGLEQLQRVIPEFQFEPKTARALIAALEATRGRPGNWIRTWAGEYQYFYRLFDETVVPEATAGTFHFNRTMTILAEYYRGLRENAGRTCAAMVAPPRPPDYSDLSVFEKVSFMATPNTVGRILAQISMADHNRYELQGCLAESHVSALQVLVALSAYRALHGAPPDTLDVLVPEWLERVPIDAFDGKPIRYSAENAVVYSVGKDFFDGGGNGDPAQGFRRVTREPTLAISF